MNNPAEDALLIVSHWQRHSEALLLKRLYGIQAAVEEIDEDAASDPAAHRIATQDDEYAWASALGRGDD